MSRTRVVCRPFVILLALLATAARSQPGQEPSPQPTLSPAPSPCPEPAPGPDATLLANAKLAFTKVPDERGQTQPGFEALLKLIARERDGVDQAAICSQSLLAQRLDASKATAPECARLENRLLCDARTIGSTAATLGLQPRSGGNRSAGLRAILVEQRRRYKFLKKWLNVTKVEQDSERLNAVAELEALRNALYGVLEEQGLRQDFGADLVQGLLFQNTAGEPGGGSDDAQPTFLRFRSRRFGHDYAQGASKEGMLTVRVGLVPILLLVEPVAKPSPAASGTPAAGGEANGAPSASPPAAGGEAPEATHEKALMFDVRFDGIYAFGPSSEFVLGASYGQTLLDSRTLIRKVNGQDTLFASLNSGPGTRAQFWTLGLAYRFFHRAMRDIRVDQPSIEPLLEFSADFRHDARFKLDPAAAGAVRFQRPERRGLVRLKLGGIPLLDTRNPTAKPVSIGLGIEHEFGWSKHGVPSATRVFLMGDLALLKAFAGK